LLDVGSGCGFYVNAASEAGYRSTGLEFSGERYELARTRMKGQFINGEVGEAFAAANRGTYTVVTSSHVVEHLRDPVSYISRILNLVAPGGAVLIEVLNLDDEMTWQISQYADHQWQVCHLRYFDKSRLELVLRQAGARDFSVVGIQRYGMRHLLRWTDVRSPDLGMPGEGGISPLLDRTEAHYRTDREKAMTCDTLIATIRV
jgi:SAM-dependent methyltransferase